MKGSFITGFMLGLSSGLIICNLVAKHHLERMKKEADQHLTLKQLDENLEYIMEQYAEKGNFKKAAGCRDTLQGLNEFIPAISAPALVINEHGNLGTSEQSEQEAETILNS